MTSRNQGIFSRWREDPGNEVDQDHDMTSSIVTSLFDISCQARCKKKIRMLSAVHVPRLVGICLTVTKLLQIIQKTHGFMTHLRGGFAPPCIYIENTCKEIASAIGAIN